MSPESSGTNLHSFFEQLYLKQSEHQITLTRAVEGLAHAITLLSEKVDRPPTNQSILDFLKEHDHTFESTLGDQEYLIKITLNAVKDELKSEVSRINHTVKQLLWILGLGATGLTIILEVIRHVQK